MFFTNFILKLWQQSASEKPFVITLVKIYLLCFYCKCFERTQQILKIVSESLTCENPLKILDAFVFYFLNFLETISIRRY